jgi:uncharacterized protein (DUF433 family)
LVAWVHDRRLSQRHGHVLAWLQRTTNLYRFNGLDQPIEIGIGAYFKYSNTHFEDLGSGIGGWERLVVGAEAGFASRTKLAILRVMKSMVVASSVDVMGGTPVFAGTRVPIENLLDYLEGGESIEDFLEGFPSVSRQQVIAFLEETKARVLAETG